MVDRCVCFDKTFAEMKKFALRYNVQTVEELKKHIKFGENCKICIPYVDLVIKTGIIDFEPIIFDSYLDE